MRLSPLIYQKAGDQTQNQSTDGAIYADFLKPSLMIGGVFKTFLKLQASKFVSQKKKKKKMEN